MDIVSGGKLFIPPVMEMKSVGETKGRHSRMKVSQLEEELAQALVVGWNYHLDMEREILFRGF